MFPDLAKEHLWKLIYQQGKVNMNKISILIVDDHSIVRRGIKSILENEPDYIIIDEAVNGEEAVQKAQELNPDVILMDLVMPGIDGIEAIRRIRESCPSTRILVLTSFSEDEKIFASIKAGAIGYLLKNTPAEDLERAIKSVAKGELHLQSVIAQKVLEEFKPITDCGKPNEVLTVREQQILSLITQGCTNKEIAEKLSISVTTVKTHVSNILSKLHLRDRNEAARIGIRKGFIDRY